MNHDQHIAVMLLLCSIVKNHITVDIFSHFLAFAQLIAVTDNFLFSVSNTLQAIRLSLQFELNTIAGRPLSMHRMFPGI